LTRLFKLTVVLTCNPEVTKKETYCDKFDSCDECLDNALKLIEKIVGPEFNIQKWRIEEIIDLKVES